MKKINLDTLQKDLKTVYSDNGSISIVFQNNDILMGVVGEFNINLKTLEKLSGCNIYFRGNSIVIKGRSKSNENVKRAIEFLTQHFKMNGIIEKEDVISSLNKFMTKEQNNNNLNNEEQLYNLIP